MLKLFKSHLAFIPVLIIISFMILLRIDVLLSDYSTNLWQGELAPFSLFVNNIFGAEILANRIFNLLLSSMLVFLQASVIISIFEEYKNNDLKSFLPAWVFVLLMHLNPDLLFLSPQLISFTFILLAFRKLIVFVENSYKRKAVFDIALFIGIASMFWLPSSIFLLFVFFFLNKKLKLDLRVFLSLIFTVMIPLFYVLSYYIISDQWSLVSTVFNSIGINKFQFNLFIPSQQLSGVVVFLLALGSIYFSFNFVAKQLMNIKELFTLIGFFIFNVLIVYLFQNDNHISLVVFLFFPVAILLSVLFNRIKRNIVAEFIHLVLLLTIIINFMNFT
ncbi:MAG: hypothetical protein ACI8ZX_001070 [Planctomycetota bacterium]|jgi:hypothetical protein